MKRFLIIGFLLLTACGRVSEPVAPGLDVLLDEYIHLVAGQRIGLITNHTALSAGGEHIVDVFSRHPQINLTALFAPEHGIRGDRGGGEYIETYLDSITGLTVYSLYQRNRKPTQAMLDSVDVLLFDIQDIGARFYTYLSTMALSMEAAADKGIPFIVLDRPNPITGAIVEGPILKSEHKSFVGMFPIPIRHGLTAGELARMINGEGWLADRRKADLTVVPMRNWRRLQWFDETGLPWIKTSPNMPDLDAATLYPGMCLLEGVNLSEGRGTTTPFNLIGAPWIGAETLRDRLSGLKSFGVQIETRVFVPVSMPNAAPFPEYADETCQGLYFRVVQRNTFRPVSLAIHLLSALVLDYPGQVRFSRGFDRLIGDTAVKEMLLDGRSSNQIIASWGRELNAYKQMRKPYLLY